MKSKRASEEMLTTDRDELQVNSHHHHQQQQQHHHLIFKAHEKYKEHKQQQEKQFDPLTPKTPP